ncbi:protein FAR1-RELATED SEQUENCE 5, partial [Trifolium medium]|nr:protein FAR1-RELATED SEQUENCE 5 [Trifolium medium]
MPWRDSDHHWYDGMPRWGIEEALLESWLIFSERVRREMREVALVEMERVGLQNGCNNSVKKKKMKMVMKATSCSWSAVSTLSFINISFSRHPNCEIKNRFLCCARVVLRITMETYDESVDADSIHSSERDSWDDELDDDGSYSVSSADKSSTDGNNDVDEVGGDNKVRFDTITAEEIRCMEFATVSEAYDFYYRYGKYNGFAVRKSDSRVTGSGDNKVIKMKQFVCNRHGVREKRHLVRTDRKLEHRRLTRTQCGARLRVNYKAEKDRYVVTAFEETHNHELTPA